MDMFRLAIRVLRLTAIWRRRSQTSWTLVVWKWGLVTLVSAYFMTVTYGFVVARRWGYHGNSSPVRTHWIWYRPVRRHHQMSLEAALRIIRGSGLGGMDLDWNILGSFQLGTPQSTVKDLLCIRPISTSIIGLCVRLAINWTGYGFRWSIRVILWRVVGVDVDILKSFQGCRPYKFLALPRVFLYSGV